MKVKRYAKHTAAQYGQCAIKSILVSGKFAREGKHHIAEAMRKRAVWNAREAVRWARAYLTPAETMYELSPVQSQHEHEHEQEHASA